MMDVKGLSFRIGEREILRQIDLAAEKGEFVGIIGPNGSGKSTLLKNLYKVLRPQGGAAVLMGEDLLRMSNRDMAQRLAVVVQEHEASFDFSVEEVIMMGRYARKGLLAAADRTDETALADVLRRTGLEGIRTQSFTTLSGGEKQRVLIARALVQDTPCLILDEPTNHLDIKYQLELMDLVKGLGKTVLAAIHDLNIAAMYCDRLYAVKDGRVVAGGTPREVLTAELIRKVYDVDAWVFTDGDGMLRVLYRPGGRP